MYEVIWKQKAYKQLRKIRDRDAYSEIKSAVSSLQAWPDCYNVKPLKNHEHGYRIRAGRWRVIFDVQSNVRIIEIQEVKKRDEHTY